MARDITHYETLGVPPGIDAARLHQIYKELAIKHHPDKGGSDGIFTSITEAYGVLRDPERRAAYDALLRLTGKVCGRCNGAGEVLQSITFLRSEKRACGSCKGRGFF